MQTYILALGTYFGTLETISTIKLLDECNAARMRKESPCIGNDKKALFKICVLKKYTVENLR